MTRKEKDISLKDVERTSGGRVTAGYVNQIENRQTAAAVVSVEKLKAIAKGLGVAEDDVFRIARGLQPIVGKRFEMYAEKFNAGDLSDSEWQFIETNIHDYISKFRLFKQEMMDNTAMPLD